MNIKVMTFNLRTTVKNDGVNYFPNREGNILAAIEREEPDLISYKTQWLSTFSNTSGSRFERSDQSQYPRIFVHAVLSLGEAEKGFIFIIPTL